MALTDTAVNSVLADEPWARNRLAEHAGRAFMVRVGPMAAGFRIDEHGVLASAPLAGATPDLVLTVSPLHVPAFLADPKRWNEFVREAGDVALGGTLKDLAQTLPWFVEKFCARALGPVVGQRVADAGRRMLEMPQYAATRVAANVGTYARDEAQVLAHPADMRRLVEQASDLASRIDALAVRTDVLAAAVPHGPVSADVL
jgi:ubiquinone biosynthesis accessory factor UbiJ